MIRSVASISSLLLGMGILLSGSGLLGILLGLRASDEQFGDFTIGIVMAGFYVGYVLGAMYCPRLIEQFGHIRAFTAFAAACSALALCYGLFVNPVFWLILRILNGIALLGLYMVIESWINHRAGNDRAQVFSVYMMVNLVALAIGQYLILFKGVDGMAPFAIVAMLFSVGLLPIALTPVTQPEPIRTDRLPLKRLFKVTPVGFAGAVFSGLICSSFWSFAAIYARTMGLSDGQAASFVVAAIAGGAFLQWPIGWLSDRYDRRHVMLGTSLAATLALVAFGAMPSVNANLLLVLAVVFGGFIFSLYGLAVAQTHDRFSANESLEATKGILMVHGLGSAVGPVLTGAAISAMPGGFALSLALMALVLAVFTGVRIWLDDPVPVQDKTVFAPMEQGSSVAMDLDPRSPDVLPLEPAEPAHEVTAFHHLDADPELAAPVTAIP